MLLAAIGTRSVPIRHPVRRRRGDHHCVRGDAPAPRSRVLDRERLGPRLLPRASRPPGRTAGRTPVIHPAPAPTAQPPPANTAPPRTRKSGRRTLRGLPSVPPRAPSPSGRAPSAPSPPPAVQQNEPFQLRLARSRPPPFAPPRLRRCPLHSAHRTAEQLTTAPPISGRDPTPPELRAIALETAGSRA
jgi:hypothetical protein